MHAATHYASFAQPARNTELFPIAPGDIVADFGAGSGHYVFEIAKILEGTGRVYAIDVQQDLLRRIKNEAHAKGFLNIDTVLADVGRLHGTKLAAGSVDVVLMSNVLFQLEHPRGAFEEARRILKLNGKLIVIDWSESPPAGGRRLGPSKEHVFTRESALDLAREVGFEPHGQFAAGAHHYGLVF